MRATFQLIRTRMDRFGIALSGLCLLHCVAGLVLVAMLGLGGEWLLAPEIHRYGLALAIVIGVITIGMGALRHGRRVPLLIATCGFALMAGALGVGHGVGEAILTIGGVGLVASAHFLNLRHAC